MRWLPLAPVTFAALIALVGLGSFAWFRPIPKPPTQFVDRVVYVQPPAEVPAQMPSLANVMENRKQLEDALEDKWTVTSIRGTTSAEPPIGAWMSEPDLKKLGGL